MRAAAVVAVLCQFTLAPANAAEAWACIHTAEGVAFVDKFSLDTKGGVLVEHITDETTMNFNIIADRSSGLVAVSALVNPSIGAGAYVIIIDRQSGTFLKSSLYPHPIDPVKNWIITGSCVPN
jgi:hypothetical protein